MSKSKGVATLHIFSNIYVYATERTHIQIRHWMYV